MAIIHLIAILIPNEGKIDRAIELLQELAQHVKENEPDTLQYEILRSTNSETKVEEIVMLESYANQAAVDLHTSSEKGKWLFKTTAEEKLLAAPPVMKFSKSVGGFASRL